MKYQDWRWIYRKEREAYKEAQRERSRELYRKIFGQLGIEIEVPLYLGRE